MDHPVRSSHKGSHNTGHKKGLISTIRERNRKIAAVAKATAVNRGRPSNKDVAAVRRSVKDPFSGMSPSQISRAINTQRIKSASKDTARQRSKIAQLKGLRKRSKRGPRSQFIEGKTKF